MSARKADGPLSVEIPSREADRPAWGKVGVITAIGFLIGVGWPRVAGVRVGPSLPADAIAASASGTAGSPPMPALALPTGPSAPTAAVAPSAAPAPVPVSVAVSVGHGAVVSCKSSSGDLLKGSDCGTLPGLDGLVTPVLRKLAECPQAAGASGKLHVMVRVDFGRGTLSAESGKGTSVADPDALVACAKTALADVHPTGIAHDNQRYGVSYRLTFGGDEKGAASGASASPAGGAPAAAVASDSEAQVSWDVAIVRDAPRTGKILAKLDRGTSVRIGSMSQGWYPVKYGDGFASEGWVYRAAIGK